jgi:spectinomycin phosphotransferase
MRTRPADVDDQQLIVALREGWGVEADALEYVAIGGGTHHWRATDERGKLHWLSLDDLDDKPFLDLSWPAALDKLTRALQSARTLSEQGLDFVLAPKPTSDKNIVVPLTARYVLSLYPFLTGSTFKWGQQLPEQQRQQVLGMLTRLHAATPLVAEVAFEVQVDFARRANLEAALLDVHQPWCGGPLAEPARAVLAAHVADVRHMLDTFDALARRVQSTAVLSHGEPHPANIMAIDGQLKLLDWDTVGLAPPERDLWWLATESDPHLSRYTAETGRRIDAEALKLYRLRWQLDDLIWCVSLLRAPHTDSLDAQLAFQALTKCAEVPAWMH